MALTIDSTIRELLDNPKSAAICEKYIPGMCSSPQISMVDAMTFPDVIPMSSGKVTEEMCKLIEADLKKLNL